MSRILLLILNFVYHAYDAIYRFMFWVVLLQYKILEQVDEERTKLITRKFLEMIKAQETQ